MKDEIFTYWEMCARENMSLQRGMNFKSAPMTSIVLMSQRSNAPYEDALSEDGNELIYEGHDVVRAPGVEPKMVDQPWEDTRGRPSENAKFARATEDDSASPPLVQVYEKLRQGIWSDKGLFDLTSYEYVLKRSEGRRVFKFHMKLSSRQIDEAPRSDPDLVSRLIPSWVKQEVYKRDAGKCVECGATDQLHFDHDFPYSKGGTSILPENVRILCARHNLRKGARIQ